MLYLRHSMNDFKMAVLTDALTNTLAAKSV